MIMNKLKYLMTTVLALTVEGTVSCSARGKVYLVAVGIADYPGDKNNLRFTVNDAKDVAWLFGKSKDTETVLLTDKDATAENIRQKASELYRRADSEDRVIFFFSGHGYRGGFNAYDGKLGYDDVKHAMALGKAKCRMLLADACYAGKIRTAKRNGNMSGDNDDKHLYFLSCRSSEKSMEAAGAGRGVFTMVLVKGLRGGADSDGNRIITAQELFTFVSSNVAKLTKDKQHPVMWGKFDKDMPVISWTGKH